MAQDKEKAKEKKTDDEAISKTSASEALVSIVTKAIAGVFVLVVAPVAVTVGTAYLNKTVVEPTKVAGESKEAEKAPEKAASKPEEKAKEAPKEKEVASVPSEPTTKKRKAAAKLEKKSGEEGKATATAGPVRPSRTIPIFDGERWNDTVQLVRRSRAAGGDAKSEGPAAPVGKIDKGQVSFGPDDLGGFITKTPYEDYRLVLEFRRTRPSDTEKAASSQPQAPMLLLHADPSAEDENQLRRDSITSVRCRFGGDQTTGELSLFASNSPLITATVEAEPDADGSVEKFRGRLPQYIFKPGTKPVTITTGTIHRVQPAATKATEKAKAKAAAAAAALEKPLGEWNTLEVLCAKDTISVLLNGQRVNALTRLGKTKGRVGIAAFGMDIQVRTFNIEPLK